MCQFAEAVVSTSEEKKAPPYMERLQKEHCRRSYIAPRQSVTFLDQRDFAVFPVSRHFTYSRDFGVSLFPDTLIFQKCLETGKTTKSIEKIIIVKGFCHFSCL